MTNTWISAHLFYHPPWEDLLTDSVFPFVQNLLENKEITEYFFIRYWEKGPHIRLRLKGNPTILKPKIEAHFQAYFQKKPSKRVHLDESWYSNNTVVFIDYKPELERYGGEEFIQIAEQHFFDSSQTILTILKRGKPWSYDNGLQTAMILHLSFIYSVGISKTSSIPFLKIFFDSWSSAVYKNHPKAIIEQQFTALYEQQESIIKPFLDHLWNDLEEEVLFEEEWLNNWIIQCKQLRVAYESSLLSPLTKRMDVYRSLIHMTNNRLGISNHDEPFIAFLLMKALDFIQ